MGLKKDLFNTVEEFGVGNVVAKLREMAEEEQESSYEPDAYLVTYSSN
jgi:hypothetical protein